MTQYLCMLKTDIQQYVSTWRYSTLVELLSQPAAKRFKSTGQSLGSTEGRCRSFVCHKCGEEVHFGRDCRRSVRVCFITAKKATLERVVLFSFSKRCWILHPWLGSYPTVVIGRPESRGLRVELADLYSTVVVVLVFIYDLYLCFKV